MKNKVADIDLQRVASYLATSTGLDFPAARWSDLQRAVASSAKEMGFNTTAEFMARVLRGAPAKQELELLINHLTVGETYFFRERKSFEILEERILPELIRAKRGGQRRLRLWSAACCTGEEAYSIAIVLRRMLVDWENWDISLVATDINSRFLEKAKAGVYGKWSFRDAPPWLRSTYFRPADEGQFEIVPEIKRMVRFERLNLAEDLYPRGANATEGMDVIFCRNVLMYFTAEHAGNVLKKLHYAQAEGGWLIVGPSELTNVSCNPYVAAPWHGAIVYRKEGQAGALEPTVPEVEAEPMLASKIEVEIAAAPIKYAAEEAPEEIRPGEAAVALANQGKLAEALARCDQWIADDKLNASSYYLRAVILQEQGDVEGAIGSLRTALYLDPNFVQAHFALGNIARNHGQRALAKRHLKNARTLVCRFRTDDPVPDLDGVTAGRFLQIVDSLIETEAA